MTMNDIVSKTLEEIKQQHITPTPSWRVHLSNYFLWSGFGALVVMSGLALAVMVRLTSDLDWDVYQLATLHRLRIVLLILPYLWIVLLLLFLVISYYNLRNTKRGYRYSRFRLMLFVGGLSFGIGSIMYATHAADMVHLSLQRSFVPYQQLMNMRERFWTNPNDGLLGGRVMLVNDQEIELEDFQGRTWKIVPTQNVMLKPPTIIGQQIKVKIIGKTGQPQSFEALEIRPWDTDEQTEYLPKVVPLQIQIHEQQEEHAPLRMASPPKSDE